MNLANQGESSGGPSVQPAKRRRGRPRKDPSLNQDEAAYVPPGFEGVKEYLPQRADRTVGLECMVGQTVTGVVEATFDAGYLVTVKIGNSSTNLRGVVFKPGHYVPITAENDVAPHVPMIRRNNVHFTAGNQGGSHGEKFPMQTAVHVPSKRKHAPPKTVPSVPPAGIRGTAFPVVVQPVGFPSGLLTSNQDKNVHVVEPLSMLPPAQSIPVGQGSEQDDDGSFDEGTSEVGQEDKPKIMTSMDIDAPSTSRTSDTKVEGCEETLKSSAEALGNDSKQELGDTNDPFLQAAASVTKPLFKNGTGRMNELLQALQENIKENQVETADQPIGVEFHETTMKEADPKNKASTNQYLLTKGA